MPPASGISRTEMLSTLTTEGQDTMTAYSQTRQTSNTGFFFDFKVFKGCTMFSYLSVAMATRLTNMADAQVSEKNDIALHWMLLIPDVGTAKDIIMGKQ